MVHLALLSSLLAAPPGRQAHGGTEPQSHNTAIPARSALLASHHPQCLCLRDSTTFEDDHLYFRCIHLFFAQVTYEIQHKGHRLLGWSELAVLDLVVPQ